MLSEAVRFNHSFFSDIKERFPDQKISQVCLPDTESPEGRLLEGVLKEYAEEDRPVYPGTFFFKTVPSLGCEQ